MCRPFAAPVMSSSPSDSLPALPAEPRALTSPAAADGFDIRQRGWAKRLLPQTTFGRSLLLIVIPLVLVQVTAAWICYDRHWETVSYRLSADVAGEIAMVIDAVEPRSSDRELSAQLRHASDMTELDFTYRSGGLLPEAGPASGTTLEKQLSRALTRRVQRPFRIDDVGCERCVLVDVQLDAGVLSVNIPRGRLFTATTYIFVLWMVGSSLVLLAVATVFLRNQVKSLRRLAAAADGFGKGHEVPFFKVEGAVEVRQAAIAFIKMRDRIRRQIRQRTQMLAGVSHDLRTPLTRMKLALELLRDDPAAEELKSDVVEMERMIHGYLDFARC